MEKLLGHPGNVNVMGGEVMAKLKRHIEKGGRYEPLVVRVHPVRAGCYQILNGHHRKKVLEQLGYGEAECVVWDVSDEDALMLLATLNRLNGEDDPKGRAVLLTQLAGRFDRESLLKQVPETRGQLEKMLSVAGRCKLVEPPVVGEMPEAMVFFVNREQRGKIEEGLGKVKEKYGRGKEVSRGNLLMLMAEVARWKIIKKDEAIMNVQF